MIVPALVSVWPAPIRLNSDHCLTNKKVVNRNDKISVAGNDSHIPFSPKNIGNKINIGMRKSICLEIASINACVDFPRDWNKPVHITWKPIKDSSETTIFTAFPPVVISSLSWLKIPIMVLGKIKIKPNIKVDQIVEYVIESLIDCFTRSIFFAP